MATATLHDLAQRESRSETVTAWRHLMWKDWRQVWQLIVGVTIIQAGLQLMMGVMEAMFPDSMRNLATATINVALAAPTLMAIGCCGILIGQERQSGSWAWSSSLPVSWRRSLLSKAVIWGASSAVSAGLLLGVAAIALWMNHRLLGRELLHPYQTQDDLAVWAYVMTLVISVEVFIYFSLVALLIKDTLMAFVIAALGLFGFHMLAMAISISSIANRWNLGGYFANDVHNSYSILIAYGFACVVGCYLLAVTYRWRWGAGQYAPLPLVGRTGGSQAVRPQRALWQAYAGSAKQPSELGMLLEHGFLSAMGLRLTVGLGAMLLNFLAIVSAIGDKQDSSGIGLCVFICCIASCFLGVSVFSGDQPSKRFRFLADRGVNWKKLLLGHIFTPALIVLLLIATSAIAIVSFLPQQSIFLWSLALSIPAFIVGMFSSLVFASPIISLTATFVSLIAAAVVNVTAIAIWDSVYPSGHWEAIGLWFPVSTLIVFVVAVRLVPRWLKVERFGAVGVYVGTTVLAMLLPGVLGLSFGFMTIPKVAWEGTPVDEIKGVDWTGGPELPKAWSHSLLIQRPVPGRFSRGEDLSYSRLSGNTKVQMRSQVPAIDKWLDGQSKRFSDFESVGAPPELVGFDELRKLNSMIESSAVIALMATDERNQEFAVRAWKANRRLMEFSQQRALFSETMAANAFVWEIWATMPDDDLDILAGTNELSEMTPPALPTVEEFREIVRARATARQVVANSLFRRTEDWSRIAPYTLTWYQVPPAVVYPPIRWAIERRQAIALQLDLAATGQRKPRLDSSLETAGAGFSDRMLYFSYLDLQYLRDRFEARVQELK